MESMLLTSIRKITAILEKISPRFANWWINQLFFSPRTSRRKKPNIPDLQSDWISFEKINGTQGQCRVYSAGEGPAVLLVHGWEGSAASLSAIARDLLDRGMRVVLFDLPAHGLSPGRKTNLIEISRIIQNLASGEGYFHALVGHSFGAACAGHAIKSGVTTDCFVSISAPPTMDFMLDRFSTIVGASEKTKAGLIGQIEAILQEPYRQASLIELVADFKQSGLVIHDRKDRMIPYGLAEKLSAAWSGSKLLATNGLGHNRILKDKEVIQAVVLEVLSTFEEGAGELSLAVNQ